MSSSTILDNIKENFKDLIRFDKERLFQIMEIIQTCAIVYSLMLVLTKLTTMIFLKIKNMTSEQYQKYVDEAGIVKIGFDLGIEFLINTLLYFYLKKFIKIIPSVPHLIDASFVPYETFDNVVDIVMLVLFIELSPTVKMKLERIYKNMLKS